MVSFYFDRCEGIQDDADVERGDVDNRSVKETDRSWSSHSVFSSFLSALAPVWLTLGGLRAS